METEQEIAQNEIDNGNFEAEQTMKRVGIPSLVIGLVVAIMLHFNMISLMPTLTIVGLLAAICLITKFSLSTEQVGTGSNQGGVLLAFSFGLIIFILFTLLMSRWVIYSFNLPLNFWVGLPLVLINLYLWTMWVKHSFDQKLEGAILVQLKLNGKYMKWGKNMRPAWWGICKVTPFIGWLEGKLEKFSEETTQITHSVFKVDGNKEDGVVVIVKVNDDAKTSFPVVAKFEATIRAQDTYIIATTEDGEKGAKSQLIPKIFGGLVTTLNHAKNSNGVQPKDVEGFEPIRPQLTDSSTTLMRTDFSKLGYDLGIFSITAVEPTIFEEEARTKARAMVAAAKGEMEAETVKVNGGILNVQKTKEDLKVSSEVAIPFVLATQGDSHRQDTTVAAGTGRSQSRKKGGNQTDYTQAAIFAAMDNDGHKHGGHGGGHDNGGNGGD